MAPKAKKNQETINSRLQLVVKSGKFTLGYKSTLKSIRTGKAKLIIVASNTPRLRVSELEYYCMLAGVPTYYFNGSNNDLGTACGRLFPVGVLSILEAGDSDILEALAPEPKKE
ncbi:hypothetical protein CANCADRAFT_132312 [Tortispora caseinolytica NRRL Y-17796]|uniref:Ribosomal protein eL8/eL30/eS12/Gadd45 domain-containing protein n=1 Tax=Tortispora caseinolytica NRRL Y-17796 TaxID=767744 RepID=A0A1E4TB43_9ASCO|nr:hypothetical protein CANCADRAFT_132312 [Tortispora caseinolytica NRRL Y-17796]